MDEIGNTGFVLFGLAASAAGIFALRFRARATGGRRRGFALFGWAGVGTSLFLFARGAGIELGISIGLLVFSLWGFITVLASVERRPDRQREARTAEPDVRPDRWRGWARGLMAMLLAGLAALAWGAAYARLPLAAPLDRVATGALLVPLLWAAGAIWALADPRLKRPFLGLGGGLLSGVSVVGLMLL